MTNTTYFHDAIREYHDSSSSSSSFSEHQSPKHGGTAEKVRPETTPSSLYTAIGKAYLACLRPLIQIEDDNSTTVTETTVSSEFVSPASSFKHFNCAELNPGTKNFGVTAAWRGSNASMFEAWVSGHKLTATKLGRGCVAVCVKVFNQELSEDYKRFLARVDCSAHITHPNIVKLLGYGLKDTHRLLVYEFTSRESLEDHLFLRSPQNFTWNLRMKVALDAAKGLAFIHSLGKENIHGYFTPSNIFVDSNYNAKLSGYGLIKERPPTFPEEVLDSFFCEESVYSVNSAAIYDAPEYLYTGLFSAKSDVYSFGVVFLEMLCGRRAFDDSRPSEEKNLVEWTDSHSSRNFRIFHVLDSCTTGQYSKDTIHKAVKLAVKCLSILVELRPTADELVQALEELQD